MHHCQNPTEALSTNITFENIVRPANGIACLKRQFKVCQFNYIFG